MEKTSFFLFFHYWWTPHPHALKGDGTINCKESYTEVRAACDCCPALSSHRKSSNVQRHWHPLDMPSRRFMAKHSFTQGVRAITWAWSTQEGYGVLEWARESCMGLVNVSIAVSYTKNKQKRLHSSLESGAVVKRRFGKPAALLQCQIQVLVLLLLIQILANMFSGLQQTHGWGNAVLSSWWES